MGGSVICISLLGTGHNKVVLRYMHAQSNISISVVKLKQIWIVMTLLRLKLIPNGTPFSVKEAPDQQHIAFFPPYIKKIGRWKKNPGVFGDMKKPPCVASSVRDMSLMWMPFVRFSFNSSHLYLSIYQFLLTNFFIQTVAVFNGGHLLFCCCLQNIIVE